MPHEDQYQNSRKHFIHLKNFIVSLNPPLRDPEIFNECSIFLLEHFIFFKNLGGVALYYVCEKRRTKNHHN
jgi:hypothetical protein